jgi:PAS domain S-box-containing protein
MIWETTRNGRITFANRWMKEKFRLTEDRINKGFQAADLFVQEEKNIFMRNFAVSLREEGLRQMEFIAQRTDKTQMPVLVYISPIKSHDEVVGMRGVMVDISDRKEIENKLKKQQEDYRKALNQQSFLSELALTFNSLEDFDFLVNNSLETIGQHTNVSRVYIFEDDETALNTSNTYEWCNTGTEPQINDLQDIPYDVIPSWPKMLDEDGLIYSENITELPKDIYEILAPQEIKSIVVYPMYFRKKRFGFIGFDECNINREWSITELELLRSVSGIFSNAFSRKKIMESLEHAKIAAETANKEKARFLSTMSHEIRTPLSAVINLSKLMDSNNLTDEQIDYLKKIKVSANNLLDIINDILDFSKIEAGKIELETNTFSLRKLFEDVFNTVDTRPSGKAVEISFYIDEPIKHNVRGDQTRLKQVIMNLVNNAVKFTDKGSVRFGASLLQKTNNTYRILFKVQDTGIGISQKYLSTLFDSFTQEDNSTTRKYGGTGLGLTISKEIIELMNGQLSVESTKGRGSTFSFELELEYDEKEDKADASMADGSPNALAGKRILVVEDNQLIQLTTKAFLKKWDIVVDVVNNGLESIEKLQKEDYDLILMDNQMPVLNGIEASKKIREDLQKNTPIVAMTADAVKEIIQECMDAGMNDYITKPYEPDELKAVLLKNISS